MTLLKVALKNLLRKRVRSIAIILAAALASGFLFGATTVLRSVVGSVEFGMERLGADIMVVPAAHVVASRKILLAGEPTSFYMDRKNLATVAAVQGVAKASPQLFMASARLACCGTPMTLLVGYDPVTDFTVSPWIKHTFRPRKEIENDDPVMIGSGLAYVTNREMQYYGKQFRIGAILHPTGLGLLDSSVFMTIDAAHDMVEHSKTTLRIPLNVNIRQISSVLVRVAPSYDIHAVGRSIEAALPDLKAIVTKDFIIAVRKDVSSALWGVFAVGVMFWLMLLVLMGLVFAMTANERERELGILRAMGATRMHVLRLLVTEAVLLTGAGGVVGIGVAWITIVKYKQVIIAYLGNIQFLWPSYAMIGTIGLTCLALMLLSGAASALYPAMMSIQREPYDAIHRDR
jgi:putative ABC transport system permease protein